MFDRADVGLVEVDTNSGTFQARRPSSWDHHRPCMGGEERAVRLFVSVVFKTADGGRRLEVS